MGSRDPLDPAELRRVLAPRWARIDVVDQTGSTNADLLGNAGAPDRTVLVAESQTAGRGRLDRNWVSARGAGLTFSVLLRPQPPLIAWGWLPLLTGVALREAVLATSGVEATLKWPNDLLAADGELKIAGILAQTAEDAIVIGIGINVCSSADELPVTTATSLALCGASDTSRGALLTAILQRLDARFAQWSDYGGDAEACGLAADYRAACATIGRDVAVSTATSMLHGRATGIDHAGRLLVDVDGAEQALGAGDVEHLRSC